MAASAAGQMTDVSITFGPFELLPSKRRLLKDGGALPVGSRAFDILLALVEQPGHPISSADLIARVWKHSVVHPGALRVHVAALRKTLQDDRRRPCYILTTPSKGYRFAAPVRRNLLPQAFAAGRPHADREAHGAGSDTERAGLLGRATVLAELQTLVRRHRCVTVTGPGGVGKSTVVRAMIQNTRDQGQAPRVVDLASVERPEDVPHAITAACGLQAAGFDGVAALVEQLRDAEFVLVLDNCEHVIDAAAQCAERILAGAARIQVVATSREPLRIAGEWVHRLAGLAAPGEDHPPGLASAMAFDAVRLFIEQARETDARFAPNPAELRSICSLCRRLEGNPLAIRLAAASLRDQPLARIEANLHHMLRESLDRDLALLTATTRSVLGCLSGIDGPFDLAAARRACHHLFPDAADEASLLADEHLYTLASKSILVAVPGTESPRYRLEEVVRTHASLRFP